MCMKNVNISTVFCLENTDGLYELVREIVVEAQNVRGLRLITLFSAMSSSEDENLTKKYNLMWTFGKFNDGKFKNDVIAQETVDTEEDKHTNTSLSTRSFKTQNFIIPLDKYSFDTSGEYFLKVYIRETDAEKNEKWQIQTINSIRINVV